ncbi:glutathione peroxidase [Nocardia sp. NPDC088792]|uniref:glutathione peroxidase n=1 Tax=Nocardia sp. NPDC088792 TaxID=3364332 RepID=UPI003813FAE7
MSLYDIPVATLSGDPTTLAGHSGKVLLIVNVASQCGLTPQYRGLERLQKRYEGKKFTVLGFPCNQFKEQEPGTPEEILEFCSINYGITFPLYEKVDVNGDARHPIYVELVSALDSDGKSGDVLWNFEKFLISPAGEVSGRFRPRVDPESDEIIAAIDNLSASFETQG